MYDEGFDRIGCIACPFASTEKRKKELEHWPKYRDLYLKAIEKMIAKRLAEGKECKITSAEEMLEIWLTESSLSGKTDDKLISLFGIIGDESML